MKELTIVKHNHRKIGINEVVFDIDCHVPEIYNPIWDRISTRLQNDNLSHQCWFTSRSPHIHCFFKDLNLYPQEIRTQLKKLIIRNYSGKYINFIDLSKVSENNMIRDFNAQHEITHKNKVCIYEYENKARTLLNPIKQKILEQLRVYYTEQEKVPKIENKGVLNPLWKEELTNFIRFCCENTLKHDGKERILFKNIVIACLLLKYNTNQRHRIYLTIVKNCNTRRKVNELIGWDKWAQKQKNLKFSWNQVSLWYLHPKVFI